MANPFALLGDEDDGAGVGALVERIAALKAAEEQKAAKPKAAAEEEKPLYKSENVNRRGRDGRGQSRGNVSDERGRGYGQSRGDFRNSKPSYGYTDNQHQNGNTLGNGGVGYGQGPGDFRKAKPFYRNSDNQHQNGNTLGNGGQGHRNAKPFYRNSDNQHQNGNTLGNGGQGHRNAKPFYRYSDNQHQNGNTLGNGGGNGGRGYARYRGESRDGEGQRFGQRDGGRIGWNNQRNQLDTNKQEQYVGNGNNSNNGHDVSGRDMHETAKMTKDVQPERVLTEKQKKQIDDEKLKQEQKRKDWEEEAKKLTLHQYEKEREKKRKELEEKIMKFKGEGKTSEGLDGRVQFAYEDKKVTLLEKKEEEFFIKPKCEKEKLKRRSSVEKEDKVRKTIIPDFKFPKPERNSGNGNGKDQGQENRSGDDYRGGSSGRVPQAAPEPKPAPASAPATAPKHLPIEDHSQFPVLGSAKS